MNDGSYIIGEYYGKRKLAVIGAYEKAEWGEPNIEVSLLGKFIDHASKIYGEPAYILSVSLNEVFDFLSDWEETADHFFTFHVYDDDISKVK